MINTKSIKNRIKSVKNTKKITKAMQMIAAVKMRKAVENAINTRQYASLASELMDRLSVLKYRHTLSVSYKNSEKVLFILVTSNKGLCGSYNSNVLKYTLKQIEKIENKSNIEVLAIGNRAAVFARKFRLGLKAVYDKLSENIRYEDVFPISGQIISDFKTKKYKQVNIVYTSYISGLSQKVKQRQILPVKKESIDSMIEELNVAALGKDVNPDNEKLDKFFDAYEFEPTQKNVLDYVLPILVEIQLYQALLESNASEHSSRMMAMKNATESAGEMIEYLTLEFNKGRQAAITQEISEIVSGAIGITSS